MEEKIEQKESVSAKTSADEKKKDIKKPRFVKVPKEVPEESKKAKKKKKPRRKMKDINIGGVSKKDILFFTKNLAVMLRAGLTLYESLDVLKDQVKGKFKTILVEVLAEVNMGHQFSSALLKYPKAFPEIYVNMVEIGEKSGRLEQNLEHIGNQLQKNSDLKKKVFGAMIYPVVILIGGIGLGLGIIIFIMPKITNLFKSFDVELPLSTRIMIGISDFFQDYTIWAWAILIFGIVFIYWFLKRKFIRPVTHWIILNFPLFGKISQHMNLAMFCRTLGTLLKSGVTIDEGIKICTKTTSNYRYKKFLIHVHERIKAGGDLTSILKQNKKLFPMIDVQIIQVGERSGTLSDSLEYCSSIHEKEVDSITKNLSTVLEPVLLIIIGVLVAFLALSIITPIYSITGEFN